MFPVYSGIIVYSTQALPDPYPQISIRLSTAAWHADNRDTTGQFSPQHLSLSFESVVTSQCKTANPRLVLALSHCLSSLSIWPAAGPKSTVPFSRARVAVLWFLLFTCLRTLASVPWLPAHLPPVVQVPRLAKSVLGISSGILLVPATWLVWAPACACLKCAPFAGCSSSCRLRANKGVTHLWMPPRGRLCSDTLS